MTLNEKRKENLESMIDGSSVSEVLDLLGTICAEKAQHIRENWQDEPMAQRWERAGWQCDRLSDSTRLEIGV